MLSTEKPCGDGELAGTEGRVGGKEEGSKEGRREREEGRMEGGWKRMLLLLGDRFNHPGEKTLLKRCWGRKKNKTVKPEPLSIKLELNLSIKLLGELHDTSEVLSRKG